MENRKTAPMIWKYGVAVLSAAVALAMANLLQIQYHFEPFVLFLCSMMVSAWFGGFKAGLLALALSLLAFHYYFLIPIHGWRIGTEMPRLGLAALTSFFVVWLTASQRRGMEALRQSELRFRRLVEAMPIAVYVCDQSGIIQSYNRAAVELWGREPKLGDKSERYCGSLRLYSPSGELLAHEKSKMEEVLRTGVQAHDWEVVVERPDGSRITALANISPLRNDEGELIGAVNCVQDISERKRAEDLLRESQQLLHLVLATLPVGVSVTDREGDIVLANAATRRIWGDTIASGHERWAQSKGFWHASGKRIAPPDWPSLRALSEGQTSVNELIDIETFDGHQKTIQNSSAPIRNAEGVIVGAVIVNEDVTDRIRAEGELRQSEERFAAFMDNMPGYAWMKDLQGRYVYVNEMARGLPGYRSLGKTDAQIWPANLAAEYLANDEEVIAAKKPLPTFEHFQQEGKQRYVVGSKFPIFDKAGAVALLGGAGVDITERVEAEEALKNSHAQLRALSARVQSVREEEATRIAREIHDDLGQKLTGLKMDLLRAERMTEEIETSPAVNSLLDTLVSATELADGIIVNVQEIAANLRPEMLDKLGLAAALCYESRRFQERTGVFCKTHLPETGPSLSTEVSNTLFRIYQECLTNIVRHAHATQVEVTLGVEEGWVNLRVQDNGRGLSEAEIANPKSLGLLGMKERAELLGGEIAFQRDSNQQGTVVAVRIPQMGEPA